MDQKRLWARPGLCPAPCPVHHRGRDYAGTRGCGHGRRCGAIHGRARHRALCGDCHHARPRGLQTSHRHVRLQGPQARQTNRHRARRPVRHRVRRRDDASTDKQEPRRSARPVPNCRKSIASRFPFETSPHPRSLVHHANLWRTVDRRRLGEIVTTQARFAWHALPAGPGRVAAFSPDPIGPATRSCRDGRHNRQTHVQGSLCRRPATGSSAPPWHGAGARQARRV